MRNAQRDLLFLAFLARALGVLYRLQPLVDRLLFLQRQGFRWGLSRRGAVARCQD